MTFRSRLVSLLALLVPLGLATKLWSGPGAGWVVGHLGGLFYVTFWTLLVLAIAPRVSPWKAAGAVLAVTCALEVLQLWTPPWLQAIRRTFAGQALLGSTFGWSDFPWYVAGALAAVGLARLVAPRAAAAPVAPDAADTDDAAG